MVIITRKKRNGQREKKSKNIVIDNRKKLKELSSKAKTSFTEQDKNKTEGKCDKKKRKREEIVQQEDQ